MTSYLDLATVVKGFAALTAAYLVIGASVNYFKLRQFKGPPLAAFSRLWLFWQSVNARVNRAQFNAIRKYGTSSNQVGACHWSC